MAGGLNGALATPAPEVAKVVGDATRSQLGDDGREALVLIGRDAARDELDEVLAEAIRDELLFAKAFIDHLDEQAIHFVIGEAQLVFVRLSLEEVRARSLVDDDAWQLKVASKLEDLMLVEVAERVERAG